MSFTTRSRSKSSRYLYSSRPRPETRSGFFPPSRTHGSQSWLTTRLLPRHVDSTTTYRRSSLRFSLHETLNIDHSYALFPQSSTETNETSTETGSSRSNLSWRIRRPQFGRSCAFCRLRRSTRRRFGFRSRSTDKLGGLETGIAGEGRIDERRIRSSILASETGWEDESRKWIGRICERSERESEIESIKLDVEQTTSTEWLHS